MNISWLLANMEAYQASRRHLYRPSSSSENWFLLVAVVVIVLLWVVLYQWDKFRKKFARHRSDNPQALFVELCKAHSLSFAERALLRKVVEEKSLRQPALVFIDPEILTGMSAGSSPEATDYAKVIRKLFGEETFHPTRSVSS